MLLWFEIFILGKLFKIKGSFSVFKSFLRMFRKVSSDNPIHICQYFPSLQDQFSCFFPDGSLLLKYPLWIIITPDSGFMLPSADTSHILFCFFLFIPLFYLTNAIIIVFCVTDREHHECSFYLLGSFFVFWISQSFNINAPLWHLSRHRPESLCGLPKITQHIMGKVRTRMQVYRFQVLCSFRVVHECSVLRLSTW